MVDRISVLGCYVSSWEPEISLFSTPTPLHQSLSPYPSGCLASLLYILCKKQGLCVLHCVAVHVYHKSLYCLVLGFEYRMDKHMEETAQSQTVGVGGSVVLCDYGAA